jgi:UPF0271 protein
VVLGDRAVALTLAQTPSPALFASLVAVLAEPPEEPPEEPREHRVGVRYDGPDLALVAQRAGLSPEAAAALHASGLYTVQLLGFAPGFAYLGPVPQALRLPRRATPRARVPAGSVGLAAGRTGIYPFASPGGWHLLGTAVDFLPWDPSRGALFSVGDRVRFEVVP